MFVAAGRDPLEGAHDKLNHKPDTGDDGDDSQDNGKGGGETGSSKGRALGRILENRAAQRADAVEGGQQITRSQKVTHGV